MAIADLDRRRIPNDLKALDELLAAKKDLPTTKEDLAVVRKLVAAYGKH